MPRFFKFTLLSLLLLLAAGCNSMQTKSESSTLSQIQQRGKLILGTSGNMSTMTQRDATGKLVGFDIDMARLMASLMEVELVTEVMPFDQLLPALKAGKVDLVLSNLTITPKRNMGVAFVGPYLTSGKCFVTKNETLARAEESENLNTPATRLAVLKGSTSEDFARTMFSQATIVTIEDYAAGAAMVKSDQVGGLLTDYPICVSTLKDNPDAGFVSLFSLLTYEPIGIALPPNDPLFVNWAENFLNRLDGTGTLEALGKRWFGKVKLAN